MRKALSLAVFSGFALLIAAYSTADTNWRSAIERLETRIETLEIEVEALETAIKRLDADKINKSDAELEHTTLRSYLEDDLDKYLEAQFEHLKHLNDLTMRVIEAHIDEYESHEMQHKLTWDHCGRPLRGCR